MTSQICVGVTGIKVTTSPQTGFGVARSLKESGHGVVGICETALTSAICAPYFDSVYALDSIYSEDIDGFIKKITKIQKETNLKVFIPCSDSEIYFFEKYKKRLLENNIKTLLPSLESLKKTSKLFLHKLSKHGLNVPKTIIASSEDDLEKVTNELDFPVVCKGILKDSYIARDKIDLLIYFRKINDMLHGGKGRIIFQEHIKGDFYCSTGVANRNSELVRCLNMKKLGIDINGSTWAGMTIKKDTLTKISEKMVKAVNWVGPFELEFIKDNDGKYWLFEINPRLPAYIYLATVSGQNLPKAIVDLALEKNVKQDFSFKKDLVFTRLSEEVVYPKEYLDSLDNGKLPQFQ
ncbi:MAG: ATP-grasp domain-containing protein [Candidatus Diapherotrites archaeon]|nr:ATP-grasp domain-containing protein [Candidatus Diapherotrites archaeon]